MTSETRGIFKILINDQIGAYNQNKKYSDLIGVDLRINGGSGKISLEKEIINSTSTPNIKAALSPNHYILNNQMDGSSLFTFKDQMAQISF